MFRLPFIDLPYFVLSRLNKLRHTQFVINPLDILRVKLKLHKAIPLLATPCDRALTDYRVAIW